MPELPDLELYLHALRPRVLGQSIQRLRIASPFLVRTTTPDIQTLAGRTIVDLQRRGKRVVFDLDGPCLAVHLMIAGRFQWKAAGAPVPRRIGLLAMDFPGGTLLLTEAGSTRRAAVLVLPDRGAVDALDPGGLEVLSATFEQFREALTRERHTLKRCLTDPGLFSGIGNAYSDEILHYARLSPLRLSDALTGEQTAVLYEATRAVLSAWRDTLIEEAGDEFPARVTAFRDGMAVHGRFGRPCPACGTTIQRLRYATNEANYCPTCQTEGRLLADRGLSRLLKNDWPRSLEELERRKAVNRSPGTGSPQYQGARPVAPAGCRTTARRPGS